MRSNVFSPKLAYTAIILRTESQTETLRGETLLLIPSLGLNTKLRLNPKFLLLNSETAKTVKLAWSLESASALLEALCKPRNEFQAKLRRIEYMIIN